MQRVGIRPDVVSYALLINAYGKARREEEALAVFEEMLDAGVRCVINSFCCCYNTISQNLRPNFGKINWFTFNYTCISSFKADDIAFWNEAN